jgi:hypothetical protein
MPTSRPFARVEALVATYNPANHVDIDVGQSFYRNGLAAYCAREAIPYSETGSPFRKQLRFLRRVRHSSRFQNLIPGAGPFVLDNIARLLGAGLNSPQNEIGRYIFHQNAGNPVRACIDACDTGDVARPELLEWCDVYFKTNFWPDRSYPPKVVPMANLNPWVYDHRDDLKQLRSTKKELDLFGFFRIWGGANEVEGVEHNITLLETLARVKCRKSLLAFLVAGDPKPQIARLEKAGVPWTTKWMPIAELWKISAGARMNVIRHGMHQCIPWRMTDILAMAGCPVLDYRATTRWPVPLQEDVHYLNLGIPYRPNGIGEFDQEEVIDRVEQWAIGNLPEQVATNTATYFDRELAPEALGEYIYETVARYAQTAIRAVT